MKIDSIQSGIVLDHIKAGKAMIIYLDLGLDKLDCTVAIIKNVKSEKMGKKDILKVECSVDKMDLDILGFIDHNITVNVIKDGEITEKNSLMTKLTMPTASPRMTRPAISQPMLGAAAQMTEPTAKMSAVALMAV